MRVLISGGGTGGHLFPAIAIAQALSRKDPEGQVLYLGSKTGLEAQVIPRHGIPFQAIPAAGLYTDAIWRNLRLPYVMPWAYVLAARAIRRFRPDAVVGTGGYVTVPVILAAARRGLPIVLLEQNLEPGRATRLLARFARAVATAYQESAGYLDGRAVLTGTPVRQDFQVRKHDFPDRPRRLLVLGGSQGALRINQAVAEALPQLLARPDVSVTHQTGARHLAMMETARASLPESQRGRYHPFAFTEDLATALRASDLVLARAGASTLSETSAVGVPMILVPGDFAGGHQRLNARPFEKAGAAMVIANQECDGPRLLRELGAILDDPERYHRMVLAMAQQGRPQAADAVADLIRGVAGD
jgi:UDP-N-acetylglucosamine--N-acetylmuramyl-(pentapeptide) pyrophosphoryl-undecaprenol N-acetylglucosamine transferase